MKEVSKGSAARWSLGGNGVIQARGIESGRPNLTPHCPSISLSCARIEARRVETPKVAPFTRVVPDEGGTRPSPLTAFSTWCSL